ncbi:uncharacterized protein LOC117336058 [Pecten maximus]|uniref:uncharacterized protein LOC117336058 n=1 Tax=Pecten maximus TaxID=6579 RepID=UPI0014582793|nr:uncharacterized protein LOC117336058 [Pecten maximus]
MSIHVFIRSGDSTKQVPVAFALMSKRHTSDYKEVLSVLLEKITTPPAVQKIVLDFESGMWKGCQEPVSRRAHPGMFISLDPGSVQEGPGACDPGTLPPTRLCPFIC